MYHPFIIVIDRSGSMEGEAIKAVNESMSNMLNVLADEPAVRQSALVSVIVFNHEAQTFIPLKQITGAEKKFDLAAEGTTAYSKAFAAALAALESGKRSFTGTHWSRPVIFFLSDGEPNNTDAWKAPLERLKKFDPGPRIYPIAFGKADVKVLEQVRTEPDFDVAVSSKSPQSVVQRVIGGITRSIHIATTRHVESMSDVVTEALPYDGTENFNRLVSDTDLHA